MIAGYQSIIELRRRALPLSSHNKRINACLVHPWVDFEVAILLACRQGRYLLSALCQLLHHQEVLPDQGLEALQMDLALPSLDWALDKLPRHLSPQLWV